MLPVTTGTDESMFSASSTNSDQESDSPSDQTTIAPQQHHSAPILLASNLQAAVTAAANALSDASATSVGLQDAGLRAAVDLMQAAFLVKATRHPALQQPTLLANPPTGSAMLNLLLVQVRLMSV